MSVSYASSAGLGGTEGIGKRSLPSGYIYSSPEWKRDPSWLTFTAPSTSDEKFIGLHAVWKSGNFLALSAEGDYTVDWGDGSATENFASGVVAYKEYDYADTDLANTNAPVTFTASTDTVNRTAHGYSNGDRVQFYDIVTTTGLVEAAQYYVINAATDTFQVSTTLGGSAVTLTNDGSATLLPYKQVVVQVYPQAGQNLTKLDLHQKHNQSDLSSYSSGFLDIAVSGANLTDLRIGVQTPGTTTRVIRFDYLEQANIVRSECKMLEYLFYDCMALENIVSVASSTTAANTNLAVTFVTATATVEAVGHGFSAGDSVVFTAVSGPTNIFPLSISENYYYAINVTADTFQIATTPGGSAVALNADGSGTAARGNSFRNMFNNCRSLQRAPALDYTNVVNCADMFRFSYALKTFPAANMPDVVTLGSAFVNCRALHTVGAITAPNLRTTSSMFSTCYALTSIGSLDTPLLQNTRNMFASCSSLTSAPYINVSSVLDAYQMFFGCAKLKDVQVLNFSSATYLGFLFYVCSSLEEATVYAPAVTNIEYMFYNCGLLEKAHILGMTAVLQTKGVFNGCRNLVEATVESTATATEMRDMFQNCSSLTRAPDMDMASNLTCSSLFANCSALESVPNYNTPVCTNFSGMFSGCYSLQEPPELDTSQATFLSSMFSNCFSLRHVPFYDTSSGTTFSSMFNSCFSLETVPAFDTSSGTNFSNMFNACYSLVAVPALNMSGGTSSSSYNNTFRNMYSCISNDVTGIAYSVNMSNSKLSSAALDTVYTNLPTVVGQTITVTGNYGVSGDDPMIATAKGWTVIG